MSWLYSRALVVEYSAANSSAGVQSAPLNSTPTPQAYWWPDKTTDASPRFPSGMTCEPLTADRGEAVLTWCLEASLARTSAQPERVQESPGSEADCGKKCPESLAKYDPVSRLWKTRQFSLLGGLEPYSETFPRWGTMRDGELFPQLTPSGLLAIRALITSESVSSCLRLQTPIADDAVNRKNGKFNSRGEPKLSAQVLRMPTPNASDATKWSNQSLAERQAKGQQVRLNTAVAPDGGNGGQLNPPWVEWLMGWPIGFTDLNALATDRFQQWYDSHGRS